MLRSTTPRKDRGFSLLELMISLAIIMILAAFTVPRVMNTMTDIKLRYVASNLGGLLQQARMQAVRRNTWYSVLKTVLPSGDAAFYAHVKGNAYAAGDPALPLATLETGHIGPGSGAPNEGFFTGGTFAINPGVDNPSFNARGLPCIAVANANTCPQNAGQGFAIFLSKPRFTGNLAWAAVIVTPSGHTQIWTYDNVGTWIQRD